MSPTTSRAARARFSPNAPAPSPPIRSTDSRPAPVSRYNIPGSPDAAVDCISK
ncbi:hypothetical protein [Thiohalophilus sp.]|uniref:hypothetical protein n=1 Tax=Thiohalophilus sp. TaxID=3028392 RepID=UPI003A0FD2A8